MRPVRLSTENTDLRCILGVIGCVQNTFSEILRTFRNLQTNLRDKCENTWGMLNRMIGMETNSLRENLKIGKSSSNLQNTERFT